MPKEYFNSLKKIASSTSIGVAFSVIGYIISFGFTVVAARYFGAEEYGLYTLAKTILTLSGTVAVMGLSEGISRYIPYYESNKNEELRGYIIFIFVYPLITAIAISLSLYLLSGKLTAFFGYPDIFAGIVGILAVSLPFKAYLNISNKVLLSKKKVLEYNLSHQVIINCALILGATISALLDLNVSYLVMSLCVALIFSSMYNTVKCSNLLTMDFEKKRVYEIGEWMSFSMPLFFGGILSFFLVWTDNLVIGKYLEPSQLGIYSIAYSIASFLDFFRANLSKIFLPVISEEYSKGNEQKIRLLLEKSATLIFSVCVPAFFVFVLCSRQALEIFYGREFMSGYTPLLVVSAGHVMSSAVGACRSILYLYKDTKFVLTNDIVSFIINLSLNIFLVPLVGITGAAIATAFSIFCKRLLSLWRVKTHIGISLNYSRYIKIISIATTAFILTNFIVSAYFSSYLYLFISTLLFCTTYLIIFIKSINFDEHEKMLARSLIDNIGLDYSNYEKYF